MIWLASKSPRRAELLRQIGIEFELLLPEDAAAAEALETPLPQEPPHRYVVRVTLAKLAMAAAAHEARGLPARPILCADTTVAIGSRLLGKPADADEARAMLRSLSGRTHRVLTAVAVQRARRVRHRLQISRVSLRRLRETEIDAYVASGECFDKAGGYAIQGAAARFVRKIEGSHSGIMGLPLYDTALLLDER